MFLEVFRRMILRDKLALLMQREGLSQEDFAARIGVSQRAVSGWLAGAIPRRGALREIAERFGLAVDDLADDARPLPAKPMLTVQEPPGLYKGQVNEAFEEYLAFIRKCRDEAERISKGNHERGQLIFEQLLATWMTGAQATEKKVTASKALLDRVQQLEREAEQSEVRKSGS